MNQEETIKKLRAMAIDGSTKAHSPYSTAKIGSAVLTKDGHFFQGGNIENSSYGGTVCAERVAIWKSVSEGHKVISKIYVYSEEGWPPCGMCRQVMSEFADKDLEIIIGDANGTETTHKFSDIFPMAFTPDHLLT